MDRIKYEVIYVYGCVMQANRPLDVRHTSSAISSGDLNDCVLLCLLLPGRHAEFASDSFDPLNVNHSNALSRAEYSREKISVFFLLLECLDTQIFEFKIDKYKNYNSHFRTEKFKLKPSGIKIQIEAFKS